LINWICDSSREKQGSFSLSRLSTLWVRSDRPWTAHVLAAYSDLSLNATKPRKQFQRLIIDPVSCWSIFLSSIGVELHENHLIFNRKIIGMSGDLSGMEAHCSSTFSDGEVISQQVLNKTSILDLTPLKCDRTPPSRDCSQRSKNVILGTAYSNRLIFGVLK
jgi:hypothetical protein